MEDFERSERHLRSGSGQVILDFEPTRRRDEARFWIAAISFLCVFSVMVIMLAVTMTGKNAMAAKLDDMTDLYHYQLNVPEPEDIYIVYGRFLRQ